MTGRRTVALTVPTLPPPATARGDFYIASVVDNRDFQNKPSDPAVPSIKGDVSTLTPEQKSMMIGRQRNGFGGAVGDIALPENSSVKAITKALIEQGLQKRGYKISSNAGAPNSASVSIDQFWAWFSPGAFSVSFEARVYCTVTITSADKTNALVVKGYGINKGQVASNANWQLAYERAFKDFLSKLDTELDKAGY